MRHADDILAGAMASSPFFQESAAVHHVRERKLSAPIYRLKRKAKLLSREKNIPLHEALDRIAEQRVGWVEFFRDALRASADAVVARTPRNDGG